MTRIERILVATDFSACSEAAGTYAGRLARQLEVGVHVVHVVDTSGILAGYRDTPFRAQRLREVIVGAEERTARFAGRHFGQLEDVQVMVPDSRDPCAAILDEAERTAADMIVMGTHGDTGLMRMILGSVAEQVVRRSTIPVLVMHRPKLHISENDPPPRD